MTNGSNSDGPNDELFQAQRSSVGSQEPEAVDEQLRHELSARVGDASTATETNDPLYPHQTTPQSWNPLTRPMDQFSQRRVQQPARAQNAHTPIPSNNGNVTSGRSERERAMDEKILENHRLLSAAGKQVGGMPEASKGVIEDGDTRLLHLLRASMGAKEGAEP